MHLTAEILKEEKDSEYIRGYMDAMALIEQTVKEQTDEKLVELLDSRFKAFCNQYNGCSKECPYYDFDGDCADKFAEDFRKEKNNDT